MFNSATKNHEVTTVLHNGLSLSNTAVVLN